MRLFHSISNRFQFTFSHSSYLSRTIYLLLYRRPTHCGRKKNLARLPFDAWLFWSRSRISFWRRRHAVLGLSAHIVIVCHRTCTLSSVCYLDVGSRLHAGVRGAVTRTRAHSSRQRVFHQKKRTFLCVRQTKKTKKTSSRHFVWQMQTQTKSFIYTFPFIAPFSNLFEFVW